MAGFGLLILWRILSLPPGGLWRDWLFLLGAFGVGTAWASEKRDWTAVTVLAIAALMILYWSGQLPLFQLPSSSSP